MHVQGTNLIEKPVVNFMEVLENKKIIIDLITF